MTTITLSIPEQTREKMKEFSEINWSGLVRKTIEEKVSRLVWQREMLKKLEGEKEFTDWTVELGRKIKKNSAEKLQKEGIL